MKVKPKVGIDIDALRVQLLLLGIKIRPSSVDVDEHVVIHDNRRHYIHNDQHNGHHGVVIVDGITVFIKDSDSLIAHILKRDASND